ncbi:Pycsar system effector family protein [Clostridium peptidivorans]|uniref:Pycsar system effector family protein n=1 Tax=Clostridium peptidivorans TaxID=100174 RepID=UPI000BE3C692|nr:Pycsar system effector family protein [Clostridium peptidivorans]
MNGVNNLKKIEKDDAINILDRTIGFVTNCDSKASVLLGVFGVLLTILFSSDGVTELKSIIKIAISAGTWYGVLYCVILVFTSIVFYFGIVKLLQVLFPKIDCDELKQEDLELNSNIFFGGICKNSTYKQYKDKMMKCNQDEYLNDIISQIYLNSVICDRKYKNFKIGVVVALIGFLSFIAVWGIGIIVY